METVEQVIDDILLASPYGRKAYEDRQERLRDKEQKKVIEEIIVDHPKQTYFNFEEGIHNEK